MGKKTHKGFFITLEGPDGSGKTTHCELLKEYLEKKGYPLLHTREPGGTALAESIRRLLLNPANTITPLAELFLYEASRAQHTEEFLRPALAQGKIVLCERYIDATLAYQGYGRKLDRPVIATLNRIATGGLLPDLTICLDISHKEGLKKARTAPKPYGHGDRLEQESDQFHARVRQGYLALARGAPKRIKIVPTGKTINDTHRRLARLVDHTLAKLGIDPAGISYRKTA